jgi:plasmid stability protein
MKATIDLDDALYRRLKVEAARRGRTIRELVADGVERVLETPVDTINDGPVPEASPAPWFGALHDYAENAAGGDHGLAAMRRSIAAGRRKDRA